MDIPRLNGAIRALEQNKPVFTTFCPPETGMAQVINAAPYDAVVFGSPTWWLSTNVPVRSFLESDEAKTLLAGKPFTAFALASPSNQTLPR